MLRKGTLAALAAMGLSILASPAAAQVVANGGFETGDLSGWTTTGNDLLAAGSGFSAYGAHSGSYFGALGDTTGTGSLSQALSTVAGQTYTLTYYLATHGDSDSSFSALWNGEALAGSELVNPNSNGVYDFYSFLVTGTGTDTLTFNETDVPSWMALDDIGLTPNEVGAVPEPATWAMMLLGFGAIGAVMRRRRTNRMLEQVA